MKWTAHPEEVCVPNKQIGFISKIEHEHPGLMSDSAFADQCDTSRFANVGPCEGIRFEGFSCPEFGPALEFNNGSFYLIF